MKSTRLGIALILFCVGLFNCTPSQAQQDYEFRCFQTMMRDYFKEVSRATEFGINTTPERLAALDAYEACVENW